MSDTTSIRSVIDLFTHDLRVEAQGTITTDQRRFMHGDANWRLALFRVESAADVHADHWEKHPLADEAVCSLHGTIRLRLRAVETGTTDEVVRLLPGQAVIVPRDRWHRFEFEEPTDLLAFTLRHGTRLEEIEHR